ncbi:MAG: type IV pilin protein [Candidatus Krumholzibacteriia bacterium]
MRGFTLVELLVVVIILGILAAVVVPQFTDHTNDARLATLDTNLAELRNAVELYYHQHNGRYPGQTDSNSGAEPAADASTSFAEQLTMYTDVNGVTSATRDDTYKYGPYLRRDELPTNPFTGSNSLLADASVNSLGTDIFDGGSAWKFAVQIGKLIANDSSDHSQR